MTALWACRLAVTPSQSGSYFGDTDSFVITVTGATNQPVWVVQNGGTKYQMGTTDPSTGVLTIPGSWSSIYDGAYSQVWSVGPSGSDVPCAPNPLVFNLVPQPSPLGPTSPLGNMLTASLQWNGDGSLAQLASIDGFNSSPSQNYGNSQVCNYTQDDLGRLSTVDCGSGGLTNSGRWGQNFGYDAYGNVSWTTPSGRVGTTFTPGTYTNNQVPTYSYDANGNVLGDGTHNYTWDAEGRVTQVTGGTTMSMVFDALGRRVEHNGGGSVKETLYGPDGSILALMATQGLTKGFIPLPAGATAVYQWSAVSYYRHPDWLGSSRIASTATGTLYYDGAYSAFGETIGEVKPAGFTDRNFTGQNQALETDLYDFPAREYKPGNGRWISPDPAGVGAANPAAPQSWNRYA